MAKHLGNNHSSDEQSSSMLDQWADHLADKFLTLRAATHALKAAKAPMPTQTGDATIIPTHETPKFRAMISDFFKSAAHSDLGDAEALLSVMKLAFLDEDWDDHKYTMERLVKAAIDTSGNPVGDKITDIFVTQLWNDLDHPPQMYMGGTYQYRNADGSNNSFLHPQLGAAHTPYARTVQPKASQPAIRPDPAV